MKQVKLESSSALVLWSAIALNGILVLACAKQRPAESSATAAAAAPEAPATSAKVEAPTSPAPAAEPTPAPLLIKDVGFATPESVLFDADADVYLVSNINGSPTGKDDNGFISQVDPNGTVITLKWIDGAKSDVVLNAPKGMAIVRGLLYVADIDFIRIFDARTGAPKGKIGIPQATFLNDLTAAPDGTLYVTDSGLKVTAKGFEPTGTDAIYKIDANGKSVAIIKGTSLNQPNGIFADESGVWVVTNGSKELYRIANGEKTSAVELPAGSLDGLVRLADGAVLVSSWESSSVFYGKDGKFTTLIGNAKSPADIGYDDKRTTVLVPLFMENSVLLQKVNIAVTPKAASAAAEPAKAQAK